MPHGGYQSDLLGPGNRRRDKAALMEGKYSGFNVVDGENGLMGERYDAMR